MVAAGVDSLRVRVTIIHLVGERLLEDVLDLDILNKVSPHRQEMIFFIDHAPIDDQAKLPFQDEVEPCPHAAAVTLTEGMRDAHLHVLLDDFDKR
ncbi:hypothetical protein [Gordonibacter sp. An230]|uniref:hypothetical protein n=1 Tax=Gordonibacter sp. An230 TaxID=1965592 RepID=UPI00406C1C99